MKSVMLGLYVRVVTLSAAVKRVLFGLFLLAFSQAAMANRMSDIMNGWREEGAAMVPVILFLIAGIGICFAAGAVISAISTKKQDRPLTWQIWGLVGGAFAVVVPVFVLAISGSLTGGEGNAGGMMNEMNLNY